ncbi:NAD-dependent succinate-semialdehyde dehydrogenase [Rhizosaccharibacter radicis]|uniref:NAD-dependent succinate-semialdehyde dehydrogenase n=1 Tax=Rhizosaccharibacter radicis TaxID=2782605 RepID=A0ABT1VUR5_9PROT|nr:NAD-dependent succinate-semialdehyde dehydrogenase [Acetobacteraceae bacterium KSS12]
MIHHDPVRPPPGAETSAAPEAGVSSIDPATGRLIRHYPFDDEVAVERLLASAAAAFPAWRDGGLDRRTDRLRTLADLLRRDTGRLAALATAEMGKPIAQARAEVAKCAALCDWYAEQSSRLLADEPAEVEKGSARVCFRPLGTILLAMPWNFPFWQVLRAAVPILAGGNTAVLRHAGNVTGCAYALGALLEEAGFPSGALAVVNLPHDRFGRLIEDDRIAGVSLTGSVGAGSAVAERAGRALKKSVLELGGSDPFIVLADADLDRAVDAAIQSRFGNTGQVCIAAKRIILEAPVAERFTDRFVDAARSLRLGDPTNEETFLGPLARLDLRDSLHAQVQASVQRGATLLLGGEMPDGPGAFYPATVLGDVRPGMAAFDQETFGPVAALCVAADEDEAIALANESEFGLSGALWTRDAARAHRLAARMETGGVFINGFSASDPRVPIGGIRRSGYGRELSHYGIREFTNAQLLWDGRG